MTEEGDKIENSVIHDVHLHFTVALSLPHLTQAIHNKMEPAKVLSLNQPNLLHFASPFISFIFFLLFYEVFRNIVLFYLNKRSS